MSSSLSENIDKGIENISTKALSPQTRGLIFLALNPEIELFTSTGLPKDWRGLAALMDFIYPEITTYKCCDNPCENLLKDWEKKEERTMGQLWNLFRKLERYDIINDDKLKSCFVQDAEKFCQQNTKLPVTMEKSLSGSATSTTTNYPECNMEGVVDEFEGVTVNEVGSNKRELFDAFVCYAPSDLHFVKVMLQTLEDDRHGLKLCVPVRDLLPGASENTITAYLISKRCKTVIIVLSPDFLNSPECDFQLKFAQALTPGSKTKLLIPILYKYCEVPAVLKYITLLNYTNRNQAEWFWDRLAKSLLNASPIEEQAQEKVEMESIKYDLPEASDREDFQCRDESTASSMSSVDTLRDSASKTSTQLSHPHTQESGRDTWIPLTSCSHSSVSKSATETTSGQVQQSQSKTTETSNKKDTKKNSVLQFFRKRKK